MAIQGSLSSVDIQDVVQLLNINRSTGILHMSSGSLLGKVFFRDGEVVNSEAEGLQGDAAAYVLLGLSEGEFNFEMTEFSQPRTIQRTIHDLILEAARRKDTIAKIRTSIHHDNIVFLPLIDVRIPTLAKDFSEQEIEVMKELNGQADIQVVIEKLGRNAFEVLYTIFELEQRGALKRVDIYKVLEVGLTKKLFGRATAVSIGSGLMDDWKRESMVYANCEVLEVRTQGRIVAVVPLEVKSGQDPRKVLLPKEYLQELEVSPGDKVLVKPVLNPD